GDAVGEAAGLGLALGLGRGALGDTPGAGEGDGRGAHPPLPGCMPTCMSTPWTVMTMRSKPSAQRSSFASFPGWGATMICPDSLPEATILVFPSSRACGFFTRSSGVFVSSY